jgi:hypothetical protein
MTQSLVERLRALRGQALVSDQAPAGLDPQGFDPSRGTFEVGFTGSQEGVTEAQRSALLTWLIAFREAGAIWQHNGDCIGSDKAAADLWCAIGGKVSLHPPAHPQKRAFLAHNEIATPKGYLERNQDIVDACTVLVATPLQFETQRSGTWATIRRARKARKPILIIWRNGSVLQENWPTQAIDAQSGETGTGSIGEADESAVGNADAPKG